MEAMLATAMIGPTMGTDDCEAAAPDVAVATLALKRASSWGRAWLIADTTLAPHCSHEPAAPPTMLPMEDIVEAMPPSPDWIPPTKFFHFSASPLRWSRVILLTFFWKSSSSLAHPLVPSGEAMMRPPRVSLPDSSASLRLATWYCCMVVMPVALTLVSGSAAFLIND